MTLTDWTVASTPTVPAPPARPEPPTRRLRLTKLSTLTPRPIQWLLPGRVPFGGLTVLAGRPGGGKSQFSIALSAQLSQSGVGSVFIGDEDGAEDTVLPRMMAAGGKPDHVSLFDIEGDDLLAELPTDVPLIEEAVRQTGSALVVLDPIQAYLAPEINANVDASIRQALRPLARMAQRTGAAVIAVTHLRKSTEGSALDRIGGSGGLGGIARSVLLFGEPRLRDVPEDADPWNLPEIRYACHVKMNGAPKSQALRCRIQGELVMAGDVKIETSRLLLEGETDQMHWRDLE